MTPYIVLLELFSGETMYYGTFNDREKAIEFAKDKKKEQPFDGNYVVGWKVTLLWEPREVPA